MSENINETVEYLLQFTKLIENDEEAKEFVRVFLDARNDIDKTAVYSELSKHDYRFLGIESIEVIEYNYTDVSGDSLYLKRPIANKIKDKKYRIKLMLFLEE